MVPDRAPVPLQREVLPALGAPLLHVRATARPAARRHRRAAARGAAPDAEAARRRRLSAHFYRTLRYSKQDRHRGAAGKTGAKGRARGGACPFRGRGHLRRSRQCTRSVAHVRQLTASHRCSGLRAADGEAELRPAAGGPRHRAGARLGRTVLRARRRPAKSSRSTRTASSSGTTSSGSSRSTCEQLDGYGVVGTGVVDARSGTLYLADAFGRLHALDVATGAERAGWPLRVFTDFRLELVWGALTLATERSTCRRRRTATPRRRRHPPRRLTCGRCPRGTASRLSKAAAAESGAGRHGVQPDRATRSSPSPRTRSRVARIRRATSPNRPGYGEHLVELGPICPSRQHDPRGLTDGSTSTSSARPSSSRAGCGKLIGPTDGRHALRAGGRRDRCRPDRDLTRAV